MSKKLFCVLLALLFMIIMPLYASAAVLWDQPLSTNTAGYTSQYTPDAEADAVFVADDFVNDVAWDVSKIVVPGTLWSGTSLMTVTALHWEIYADAAGIPAGDPLGTDPAWSLALAPTNLQVVITPTPSGFETILTLTTPVHLNAGHWWLVFYPEASFSVVGYGRQPSDTSHNLTAKVINPSGHYGYDIFWRDWNSVSWANPLTQTDAAFRLESITDIPNISVSSPLAFGSVLVNTTSPAQAVTISNTGTATLNINAITITGANANQFAKGTTTCGATLAASSSCTQNVTFTPTSVGVKAASLDIASNDPDTATASVVLGGTGISPNISVSSPLAFGSVLVGATSAIQTVSITNTGTATLNINAITITGIDAAQFAKGTTTCGATLAASSSCTQNVTFTPTSVGVKAASLDIASNDPDTATASVVLGGTGISPNIAVSSALNFGSVLVGATSAIQTVSITNTGNADLSISGITFTGTNPGDFAKAGGTCGTVFPRILAASASCTQNVTFTPTAVGARSANLAITSNDPDTTTASVGLSGTGISPDIEVAPVTIDFNPEMVGDTSAASEVTISNIGNAPLVVNSIVISGTNVSMFAVATGGTTPCASLTPTIVAGANCTVNVTFSPASLGAKVASLDIASNDGATPTASVPLTGTGIQSVLSTTEGTLGTEFNMNGSGFGDKKGKVYIGDLKQKVDSWADARITAILTKYNGLAVDTPYDVSIEWKPKGSKTTNIVNLPNAFTLRRPSLDALSYHGSPDTEVTVTGMWFGTKKGKVIVNDQKCKVTNWSMNPTTGVSTLTFVVHKKLLAGNWFIDVENKIGIVRAAFIVD